MWAPILVISLDTSLTYLTSHSKGHLFWALRVGFWAFQTSIHSSICCCYSNSQPHTHESPPITSGQYDSIVINYNRKVLYKIDQSEPSSCPCMKCPLLLHIYSTPKECTKADSGKSCLGQRRCALGTEKAFSEMEKRHFGSIEQATSITPFQQKPKAPLWFFSSRNLLSSGHMLLLLLLFKDVVKSNADSLKTFF